MSNIYLEVNGIRYEGWTNIEVSRAIENLSGHFRFSTTVKEKAGLVIQNDLKAQDEVKIFIDDNLVLTGYIEELNISYSIDSHSIEVSGRDKTGDLIDSSIIQKNYKQKNFIKLANIILQDNGYPDIKVINKVQSSPVLTVGASESNGVDLESGEHPTTEQGDTIASCLDKYARKIQVLLITDKDGNINISKEGDKLSQGDLISGGGQGNILSASININTTDRFRYIEVFSQPNNNDESSVSVEQKAIVQDDSIRSPRRKRISVATASETNSLTNLAKWNVNIRRAKGLRYNCSVQGFYSNITTGLWEINSLAQVRDDRCQINGQFLIQGITYRKDENGSFTDLDIVERGAFSVEPVIENTGKQNDFAQDLTKILAI